MPIVQPRMFSTPAKPATGAVSRSVRGSSRVADQGKALPRCCSNCWRMGTRLDGRDALAYVCLEDPHDRELEVGELDPGMILESMECPDWRQPGGNLRAGLEETAAPERAVRYAEQIQSMEVWNRGH